MALGVHLVGSLPLESETEVFTQLSQALTKRLRRLPDGETGKRHGFVDWQAECFPPQVLAPRFRRPSSSSSSSCSSSCSASTSSDPGTFRCLPDDIRPTGYDSCAYSSYQKFCALRGRGVVPPHVRFQVCIPTPLNAVATTVDARFRAQVEPWYEKRVLDALDNLQQMIPAQDLAVQIDMEMDVALLEREQRERWQAHGGSPSAVAGPEPWFHPVCEGILARLSRLAWHVRDGVDLGFHLCYHGADHGKSDVEVENLSPPAPPAPRDLNILVRLANDIHRQVAPIHPISWFHMPVPKDRTDVYYFLALDQLDVADAELFLGLVHADDLDGTRRRIEAAMLVYPKAFAVATECGMGRTPVGDLDSILQISAAVSRDISLD